MDTINAVIEPLFNIVQSNINVAAPTGILLLGLVTGLRHSIEADHVAAVLSVVASNHKNIKRASMLGAIWGLGHTTSLFIAGLLVLLLSVNISETVSNRLEFVVGIMLLFLGVTTITGWSIGKFFKGLRDQKSSHKHIHHHQGKVVHSHGHVHDAEHGHGHKSLIVGMVHGMAGSGALLLIGTVDHQFHTSGVSIHCNLWGRFYCGDGGNKHTHRDTLCQTCQFSKG